MMGINRKKMFKMHLGLKWENSEEKTQDAPRPRDQCDREGSKILGDTDGGILAMKLCFLDIIGMLHM